MNWLTSRTSGLMRGRRLHAFPRALSAALCALVLGVSSLSTSAPAAQATPTRPTIVLVHGAWASASSWSDVARELRDDGYRTVSPELGMNTLAADVATVRSVLDSIEGPAILVAHSYGGMVASGAAAGRTDVQALVYSAAFVPDIGDSVVGLGTGFTPSEAFGHLAFTGAPFASPAYIAPDYFGQFFAQDLSVTRAALLNASQHPINFPVVLEPSGPVGWHDIPSWYAISGSDRMSDPAQQRWMSSRAGATTVEFADASHAGGLIRYANRFTALIERADRATD